jgi:hypothetical protein
MDEETKETLLRFAMNISRAQHGALDSDEGLEQFMEDFTTLINEATKPQPARRGESKDASPRRPGV